MAKYYGAIGFAVSSEIRPGVWDDTGIEERCYGGDLLREYIRSDDANRVNDDVDISHEISIVSDPYALKHYDGIRYATIYGVKWRVSSVEIQYPRIKLRLGGGTYNG